MKSKLINTLLIGAVVVLSFFLFRTCEDKFNAFYGYLPISAENNKILHDSLIFTRNKLKQQIATTGVLQGDLSDLKMGIASDKETIKRLQEQAKKYKCGLISATSINISTHDTARGKTTIVGTHGNPVIFSDIDISGTGATYIYPTYQAIISKSWATYDLTMDKDSAWVISQTDNKLDMVQNYERPKGFLKRKELKVNVTNLNPDTGVIEMSSFHIKEKKKYKGVKILITTLIGMFIGLKL